MFSESIFKYRSSPLSSIFSSFLSYLERTDQSGSFDYLLRARAETEVLLVNQALTVPADVQEVINNYSSIDEINYRRSVFSNLINSKISGLAGVLEIDYDSVYNKTTDLIFDSILYLTAKDSRVSAES